MGGLGRFFQLFSKGGDGSIFRQLFLGVKKTNKEENMNRKILRLVEVVILASVIFAALAYGQSFERVIGYETLTVTAGAVKVLTAGTYGTSATKALVTLEGLGNLRYTLDGTTPTTGGSGVGHLWVFNSGGVFVTTVPVLWLGPNELRGFKAIATPYNDSDVTADNTAVIKVTYFAKP
jgi:hypothetical protein